MLCRRRKRLRALCLFGIGLAPLLCLTLVPFYQLHTSVPEHVTANQAAFPLTLELQNERTSRLQQGHTLFDFCNTTLRCQPIPLTTEKFSYVHISKNSGVSWIRELKKLKQVPKGTRGSIASMTTNFAKHGLYPTADSGAEHGAKFQDSVLKDHRPFQRFVTLRTPRHQVWSMFSHCYYSEWGKKATRGSSFPREHPDNDVLDFELWTELFLDDEKQHLLTPKQNTTIRCYHPQNYQSRAMVSTAEEPRKPDDGVYAPKLEDVLDSYWSFNWVALTSFFHESKCVLYYRLDTSRAPGEIAEIVQQYLDKTCRCDDMQGENIHGGMDVKMIHATRGHRTTMLDIPKHILRKVDLISEVDRALYEVGVEQFVTEVVWLEWKLQRRVFCDPVLEKWEKELSYLESSVKALYYEKRRLARMEI